MSETRIEITRLTSSTGPLTKRISLSPDGRLLSDGSACVMGSGEASRVRLAGVAEFANMIGGMASHEAIALGALRADLPDKVEITTATRLDKMNGTAPPGLISRTAGHIGYQTKTPAFALLDYDTKAMPESVAARLKDAGGFWRGLVAVLPELAGVARVTRSSTSSGIVRTDTGEGIKGSDGLHVFVLVNDGSDIERFLKTLHDRCWLAGFGWMMVGAGGQFLDRSIVDRMVCAGERIVFEGPPVMIAPLAQDAGLRTPRPSDGHPIDTVVACRPLTVVEQATLRDLKATERHRLGGPAAESRASFIREHAARIMARTGAAQPAAERMAERQCGGVLLPGVLLPYDAEDMAGCTVRDTLADPKRFVGATLADPLEGVAYGRCKAKIMQRADGTLWVNSFAHGRLTYELKYDAAGVETAITGADPAEAANVFIKMLPVSDIAPEDEQRLREMVSDRAKIKARPLGAKIKAARADQAKQSAAADQDYEAATRLDRRVRLPVPAPDAERLPVLQSLDEVLSSVNQDEPPMRDLDGHPVEVRARPPMMLHQLTSCGANQPETAQTRLPAPVLPLITRHDRYTLAHVVERHIEFVQTSETEGDRAVALPPVFVDHFAAYRDSRLPRVGAIVTAPLVMQDGTLLATSGLDRERKLVFRIEPRMVDMLPAAQHCTPEGAAKALDFLARRWLCDVATDFQGKVVLIGMALTILERVLLPERPAFFVTAGKRGGGKTTALMMVILAVTGRKPAAAAWSTNEEERRKAVLAYLAEGVAAVVWDNIPLGTTLACQTIEKVLTAESYTDRVLGQSANMTVPAYTVMSFTGNNISPRGDLASRSLIARLEVDRPDPENRAFTHADPVAWTLENRGAILSALYTLLLSNPQLKEEHATTLKTRFKTWWLLIGSALEHAAKTLEERQRSLADKDRYATQIDFNKVFAGVEQDDEEGSLLADVLDVLRQHWPDNKLFQASDVAKLINEPMSDDGDGPSVLRGYFDATGRRTAAAITPIMVGRRLTAIVGAPVYVADQTMRLDRTNPTEAGARKTGALYRVKVL